MYAQLPTQLGVASAALARHKPMQTHNVLVAHEQFKEVYNAASASAVAPTLRSTKNLVVTGVI
jgi:hypothetical protein